jgi:hypothetical protein
VAGCGSLRQLEVFRVAIVNDTAAPVVVRDCDGYCSSSLLTCDLQPGESAPINRAAKIHKLFSVTTPAGGQIGCLDLYYKTPQPGAQARVSQATPCPSPSRSVFSRRSGSFCWWSPRSCSDCSCCCVAEGSE